MTMTHFQRLPLTVFGKIKDGSSNNGKVNEQEVTDTWTSLKVLTRN